MNSNDLLQNLDQYAQSLARREYDREGIEMFLALDNLRDSTPPATVDNSGPHLAQLTEAVATRLMAAQAHDPVRALRNALEIAASFDFGRTIAPLRDRLDPSATGAGRSPLRLATDAASGAAALVHAIGENRFIRTINYHNTRRTDRDALKAQLVALADRYVTIDLAQLARIVAGEAWTDARPPLLLVFYEGLRNHYDVAAPLLDELDLTAIFPIIPGFLDAPVPTQVAYAGANYIGVWPEEYRDGRVAMTWAEARELAERGHAFVCHTMNHTPNDLHERVLLFESVTAIERMADQLGQPVTTFVWRKGVEWGVVPAADALLQESGIELLVSNFKVQRIPPAPTS